MGLGFFLRMEYNVREDKESIEEENMGCLKASTCSGDDMRTRPRAMKNEVFHGFVEWTKREEIEPQRRGSL